MAENATAEFREDFNRRPVCIRLGPSLLQLFFHELHHCHTLMQKGISKLRGRFGASTTFSQNIRDVPDRRRRLESTRHSGTNRSEEHTSELQSRPHLVCRLLLEK